MEDYFSPVMLLIILNILLLACMAVLVWFFWRRRTAHLRVAGPSSPRLGLLHARLQSWQPPKIEMERTKHFFQRLPWQILLELGLLGVWAMYVGGPYLDLNPHVWPMGREAGLQFDIHYFWINFQRCGACALWDGTINGGIPALANPFGGVLHPVVALTTAIFGVINGAKIALVTCFWLAGVAQWWMAKSLKVGWLPRLWSAAVAIAGGYLAARMATGQFTTILSVAACSLALAAALHLAVTNRWRAAAVLALFGGMAIVSGHGYVQLNLIAWAPAFLFIVLDKHLRPKPIWRKYAAAVGLSILIAGIFLVPVLHFLPMYTKDSDMEFSRAQPVEYSPLNLVTRDYNFLRADVLGKFDAPELFGMYIGWVPIIFAVLTLRFARRKDAAILLCLTTGIALSFIMGSAIPMKVLAPVIPFLGGFRHPSLSGLLAVPGILALAAYGLDGVLKLPWPRIGITDRSGASQKTLSISSAVVLLIPLAFTLTSEYEFTRYFIGVDDNEKIYQQYYQALDKLKEPGMQWISPPYGDHYLVEPALEFGLKLTEVSWPESWRDRTLPEAKMIISRQGEYPGSTVVGELDGVPIYYYPDRTYAYVETADQRTPCVATGQGGDLSVTCTTDQPGRLIAQEYSWNGWWAQRDGADVPLLSDQWLSVEAPAGAHTYEFHYRPWDVTVGLILTVVGLVLTGWLWLRPPDRHLPDEPSSPVDAA
jgi:hypothetical protein